MTEKLCGSLCLLCVTLCNKKENYTENHREKSQSYYFFIIFNMNKYPPEITFNYELLFLGLHQKFVRPSLRT